MSDERHSSSMLHQQQKGASSPPSRGGSSTSGGRRYIGPEGYASTAHPVFFTTAPAEGSSSSSSASSASSSTAPSRIRATLVDGDEKFCPICLAAQKTPVRIVSCRHAFCASCLLRWAGITNSCPLCKAVFTIPVGGRDNGGGRGTGEEPDEHNFFFDSAKLLCRRRHLRPAPIPSDRGNDDDNDGGDDEMMGLGGAGDSVLGMAASAGGRAAAAAAGGAGTSIGGDQMDGEAASAAQSSSSVATLSTQEMLDRVEAQLREARADLARAQQRAPAGSSGGGAHRAE